MKRAIAMSAAVCGVCVGLVAPLAPAAATSAPPVFESSVATPGTPYPGSVDVLGDWVRGPLDDVLVVVVPGTDDERSPRIDGIIGDRDSMIITYPESFWPIISGKSGRLLPLFAPTYDTSRSIAVDHTLEVMAALTDADRPVVYTGYSQGSDALGNAAEQAWQQGWLGENHTILLVSDPRGPWGAKSQVSKVPLSSPLLGLIGVTNDGARNPADTGDVEVVQVIVQGDPVGHFQWVWYRPVSSALVNAVGFLVIHSGTGPYTYAHLENLDHVKTLKSAEGNTTYEIYDTYHPLALLNALIYDTLGIPVSQQQLERWDRAAEAFYPTQEITPGNADPAVRVAEAPLSTPSADRQAQSAQTGRHRLLDDDGQWAEAVPLEGAAPSTGPRHGHTPDAPSSQEVANETVTEGAGTDQTGASEPSGAEQPGTSGTGTADTGAPDAGDLDSDAADTGATDAGTGTGAADDTGGGAASTAPETTAPETTAPETTALETTAPASTGDPAVPAA